MQNKPLQNTGDPAPQDANSQPEQTPRRPEGSQRQPTEPRHRRMRLPFEPRKSDPGEWSYDHRKGILITLILYMVLGIAFLWGKIDLSGSKGESMIIIDFPDEEEQLTPEEIALLRQLQAQYDDFNDVRNMASNRNSEELNSQLRDAKGTDASEIYDAAQQAQEQLRASREANEAALAALQRSEQQNPANDNNNAGSNTEGQTGRVKGRVTVEYSFVDPVRNDVKLVVPAYKCEGGGEVVVDAVLDDNGVVVAATVNRSLSSSDRGMQENAVGADRSSKFNVDSSAPSRHRGTISYIFIPQ